MKSRVRDYLQTLVNDNKRLFVYKMPRFRLNINKQNSLEHELKKAEILTKSLHNGFNAWTEVTLNTNSVADVVILDTQIPIVYEVLKTQSDKNFSKKKFDNRLRVVKVKI